MILLAIAGDFVIGVAFRGGGRPAMIAEVDGHPDLPVLFAVLTHARSQYPWDFQRRMSEGTSRYGLRIRHFYLGKCPHGFTGRCIDAPGSYFAQQRRVRVPSPPSPELIAKLMFLLDYSRTLPSWVRWIFRLTDDECVNWREVRRAVAELEERYDAANEFVILGNCLDCPPYVNNSDVNETWFLQGGSGWVMSRAAVEQLAPLGRDLMDSLNHVRDDDRAFSWFLRERFGLRGENVTSPLFSGETFMNYRRQLMLLEQRMPQNLPACPSIHHGGRCGEFVGRARDIVFLHEKRARDLIAGRAAAVFGSSDRAGWYMDGCGPILCYRQA